MLVSIPPSMRVAQLMGFLKGKSTQGGNYDGSIHFNTSEMGIVIYEIDKQERGINMLKRPMPCGFYHMASILT